MATNGRHGGQETCFTGPIFAMGAVGGIALDVVTLYFSGFSSSAQSGVPTTYPVQPSARRLLGQRFVSPPRT